MSRRAGDGAGLLAAFRAAVDNLAGHVDEVNALNVFPVPDGDTGSNMLATVRAALAEAEAIADPTADRIAAAISFGALMGARGNSGVIASQIFRGMAEGLGGKHRFNGPDLAHALTNAESRCRCWNWCRNRRRALAREPHHDQHNQADDHQRDNNHPETPKGRPHAAHHAPAAEHIAGPPKAISAAATELRASARQGQANAR